MVAEPEVQGQIFARDGAAACSCGLSVLEPESCLPPDSLVQIEYATVFVQTKKLLCPKHGFLAVSVVGRSESTKSLYLNSGHNSGHQL